MENKKKLPEVIKEQTKIKHKLLEKYIGPWMTILFRNQKNLNLPEILVYIDGFSGPGIYYTDDTKKRKCYGSPLIVAHKANKFIGDNSSRNIYIYCIDNNKECTDLLKKELEKINIYKQKWEVYYGKFQDNIFHILNKIKINGLTNFPMFIFIDPFGYTGYPT